MYLRMLDSANVDRSTTVPADTDAPNATRYAYSSVFSFHFAHDLNQLVINCTKRRDSYRKPEDSAISLVCSHALLPLSNVTH